MGQGPSSQGWRRRAQARRRLSSLCAVYRRRTPRDAAVCAYSPSLLYGRLYGIRLYFAVFSCISLHTGATPCPASLLAPYSHTTPYSTIQRCMSIQPYSTIHHTAHTAPLSGSGPAAGHDDDDDDDDVWPSTSRRSEHFLHSAGFTSFQIHVRLGKHEFFSLVMHASAYSGFVC